MRKFRLYHLGAPLAVLVALVVMAACSADGGLLTGVSTIEGAASPVYVIQDPNVTPPVTVCTDSDSDSDSEGDSEADSDSDSESDSDSDSESDSDSDCDSDSDSDSDTENN